jgi:hypothetical protein
MTTSTTVYELMSQSQKLYSTLAETIMGLDGLNFEVVDKTESLTNMIERP